MKRGANSSPAAASSRRPGEIVAQATGNGDEVFIAKCNLDISRFNKEAMFNFAQHRRVEHYQLITERTGAIPPA